LGVRTTLYCADEDFHRVEPCGGDFIHLHRVIEELPTADDIGLLPEAGRGIAELGRCLIWWETVHEYLREEVKAGRIDARELDAVDVTSHTVELGFRCPDIKWMRLARGRECLSLLRGACDERGPLDRYLAPILQFQAGLDAPKPKARFWPFGRRAAPPLPIMEDGFPFTRPNIVEELDILIEDAERAQKEGFSRMMLFMGD